MAKSVSGTVTRYLVDDLNPTGYPQVVEELSGTGVVQRQYSYGLQRINENQVISSTWTPSFYGYDRGPHGQVFVGGVEDGMGNVRNLTSSTGAVTDSYDYDAFGNLVNSTGTTPNVNMYRGEQFDSDLGLYYLRARYYNPLTGRFMGRDPEDGDYSNPATLHKYLYANGDPVNGFDPTGRQDATAVVLIDINAAIRNAIATTAVALAATCVLNTAKDLVKGVVNDITKMPQSITFGFCSAKVNKCRKCLPVDVGGLAYRVDKNPKKPHYDKGTGITLTGDHWHLYEMNQSPYPACRCFWDDLDEAGPYPPPPAGAVPISPASGGGPE